MYGRYRAAPKGSLCQRGLGTCAVEYSREYRRTKTEQRGARLTEGGPQLQHISTAPGALSPALSTCKTVTRFICSAPAILLIIGVAVGETAILLHPPSTFRTCFNRDGERASSKWQSRQWLHRRPECVNGCPCGCQHRHARHAALQFESELCAEGQALPCRPVDMPSNAACASCSCGTMCSCLAPSNNAT